MFGGRVPRFEPGMVSTHVNSGIWEGKARGLEAGGLEFKVIFRSLSQWVPVPQSG